MRSARASRRRARDLDRVQTGGILDSAYAEGQVNGEEHRSRSAAAMTARTIADLEALVADLQVPPDLVPPPAPARVASSGRRLPDAPVHSVRRRFGRAVVMVALALIIGSIWISSQTRRIDPPVPAAPVDAPAAAPDVAPVVVEPVALHTPEGFRRFVEAVRAQFGTTEVDEAVVFSDFADIRLPVPGAPGRYESYTYRGGFGSPTLAGARRPDSQLVDLASFDADALLGLLANAGEDVNVKDPARRSISIRNGFFGPQALIIVSNEFWESGSVAVRPDGTVADVQPVQPR